ncbi:glycoside hydrolase [Xylariales sp. PMI_506]|nr:glycoside hydrolase [Xylariales sp. PMI_506]
MMMMLTKVLALLLAAPHHYVLVQALAGPAPAPTPAPNFEDAVAKRATATCTFSGSSGYASASASKASCSTIILNSLTVPGGTTLNLEKLNDGTTVIFEGTTTFGYSEWSGPLFSVSGNSITVRGAAGSVLDGQGALYWDGMGNSGGVTKPKFFKANNLNDSVLDSITILNAPINSFSLNHVNNLTVQDVTVDDAAGAALGKNTDGFNVNNADGVTILRARVTNQDDCVAVNTGTNVLFADGYCSGGHGLSIGSVGGQADSANAVSNVTFRDSVVVDSQQSVRIKTIAGATGSVDGVTYRNVSFSGSTSYGIIVTQSYSGTAGDPTNGVPITNFVLEDVVGTVESSAVDIYIECGEGSCSDWTWTGVQVTGGKESTSCLNVPEGAFC